MTRERMEEEMASSEDPLLDEQEMDYARPLGLTGLQNLGNTCYMNAALQALSNCPQLTGFMLDCSSFISKQGLAKAYLRLMRDMWSDRRPSYVVPSGIAQGIKKVCPAFKGYSQHDAQEFLRCLLDQLHEELKDAVITPATGRDKSPVRKGRKPRMRSAVTTSTLSNRDDGSDSRAASDEGDSSEGDYETCDSGLSCERSTTTSAETNGDRISGTNIEICECDSSSVIPNGLNVGEPEAESGVYSIHSVNVQLSSSNPSSSSTLCPPHSRSPCGHEDTPSPKGKITSSVKRRHGDHHHSPSPTQYRSIISDIFDGKILSSVQCLTCDNISTTRETFQDLSLSIPTREQLNVLRASRKSSISSANLPQDSETTGRVSPVSISSNASNNSAYPESYSWIWTWIEWLFGLFWGPTVALEDCLSAFFSADELKGDNMYSCEKCKKLRNGIKYSKVTQLPDILCIHLKRFRHELMYSSKISNQVTFPLEGLDMSPYVISDPDKPDDKDKITTYDLVSVICHHGTPASGHYTAYCLNSFSDTWYEFDDQYVTAVDPHQVAACEAYVLFYRKNTDEVCQGRLRMVQMIERAMTISSDTEYYISNQWINRFNTFAEPGPITNFDVLCEHGRVQPSKAAIVKDLCTGFPKEVWVYMQSTYGGGPEFTSLDPCVLCSEPTRNETISRFRSFFDVIPATSTSTLSSIGPLVSLADSAYDDQSLVSTSLPSSSIEMQQHLPSVTTTQLTKGSSASAAFAATAVL